jgi:hypothetical protein
MKFQNHDKIWTIGSIGHVAKDRHFADWKVKGTGHVKSRNAKMRNCDMEFRGSRHRVSGIATWSFGVSGIAIWSVKISSS